MPVSAAKPIRIYLETTTKRTFACAVDWPGWCRSGKTAPEAIETLGDYAYRYAVIVKQSGLNASSIRATFQVVEEISGGATTDFGAPGYVPAVDSEPVSLSDARGMAKILRCAWDLLDEVAETAPPILRKGPRGGGRDRDSVIQHVLNAEQPYAAKLGIKFKPAVLGDRKAIELTRSEILAVISSKSDGSAPKSGGWPVRYAARRFAWHVLDHIWEVEDKSS